MGRSDFSVQFRKKKSLYVLHYKRKGYNINVMRQSGCFVCNTIMVDNYDSFFNCSSADGSSDSMMAPT